MPASSYAPAAIESRNVSSGGAERGGRVGREVRHLDDGVREARRHRGHGADAHGRGDALALGVVHRCQHDRRAAVGGRADLEQAQRVGHDGAGQHFGLGDLFAVAGVRVVEAVLGVLDLHLGEVGLGRAVEIHAPTAYSAKYVGLVAPSRRNRNQSGSSQRSPATGARKPLGVVSAPTTRATSHSPGEDPRSAPRQRGHARRAGGVRRRDAGAVPSERLRDRRGCDVTGVAVANGFAAGDELHVGPVDAGVVERGQRGVDAVLVEGRPHLPHSCMPAPRTATLSGAVTRSDRLPAVHQVLNAVDLVQRSTTNSTGPPTFRSSTP